MFNPLLVFNEVRETNSEHRFNFITAGEGRLGLLLRKEGMKRKLAPAGLRITYFQNALVFPTASSLYAR